MRLVSTFEAPRHGARRSTFANTEFTSYRLSPIPPPATLNSTQAFCPPRKRAAGSMAKPSSTSAKPERPSESVSGSFIVISMAGPPHTGADRPFSYYGPTSICGSIGPSPKRPARLRRQCSPHFIACGVRVHSPTARVRRKMLNAATLATADPSSTGPHTRLRFGIAFVPAWAKSAVRSGHALKTKVQVVSFPLCRSRCKTWTSGGRSKCTASQTTLSLTL